MTAVILTIHSLIVIALIGVVLLQRSDGGALGLGGGGGGGFMTGRGAANALTRTTSILAALFFATSIILAIRAGGGGDADAIADELTSTAEPAETQPAPVDPSRLSAEELLNSLDSDDSAPEQGVDDGHDHEADAAAETDAALDAIEAEAANAPAGDTEPEDAPAETPEQ